MKETPIFKYEPSFKIPENHCLGIGDRKIGEKIKGIINYEVIEKTKNYAVLRILSMNLILAARVY